MGELFADDGQPAGKWDAKRCGCCRAAGTKTPGGRCQQLAVAVGAERTLAPVGARRAWIDAICPWLRVPTQSHVHHVYIITLLKFDAVFAFFKTSEFDVAVDRDTTKKQTRFFSPPVLLENGASPKISVIRACIYKRTTCYNAQI
jgi:hypothetical protein